MSKPNSNAYRNAVAYVSTLRLMERAYLLAFLKSGVLEERLKELPAEEALLGGSSVSVLRQVLETDLKRPMAVTPPKSAIEADAICR
jgi:hypothetical protein